MRMGELGDVWSAAAPATGCSPLEVLTNPPVAAVRPPAGTQMAWSKANPPLGAVATANAPYALPPIQDVEM